MNPQLVSVIITTYNRPELLKTSINSVINQTYKNLEILVIDDGSPIPANEIVTGFDDHRIKYIYQNNQGLSAARNTGIKNAKGDYIAFLDDDDVFLEDKISLQMMYLQDHPELDLVMGGCKLTNLRGEILKEVRPWVFHDPNDIVTWIFGCPTQPSVILTRKKNLEIINGFDEKLKYAEDWDLLLRLAYTGCKMAFLPQIISSILIDEKSHSQNMDAMYRGIQYLLNKFFNNDNLPDEIYRLKDKALANVHLVSSIKFFTLTDKISHAKSALSRGIKTYPQLLNDQELFISVLINHALTPRFGNYPPALIKKVYKNLPSEASHLLRSRRKTLGIVYKTMTLEGRTQKNRIEVIKNIFFTLFYDPSNILDIGVLSILLDLLVGKKISSYIRNIIKNNCQSLRNA